MSLWPPSIDAALTDAAQASLAGSSSSASTAASEHGHDGTALAHSHSDLLHSEKLRIWQASRHRLNQQLEAVVSATNAVSAARSSMPEFNPFPMLATTLDAAIGALTHAQFVLYNCRASLPEEAKSDESNGSEQEGDESKNREEKGDEPDSPEELMNNGN